jgi:polar amino acid transport system permease protein
MAYDFQWAVLLQYKYLFLQGLLVTLELSAWTILISLPLGTLVALARVSEFAPLRVVSTAYVEVFRNTPLLVQIFYFYFAVGLESFPASLAALIFNSSAFIGEVVRSGIQSIPKTQHEAAYSTGLSRLHVTTYIILPQTLMIVIPPLGTEILNIVRNSSMAMAVGVAELTFQTQQLESITFRGFEAATAVSLIYLSLSLIIVSALGVVERVTKIRDKLL